ncbi:MAG: T9SS type A sorting domain-containing protein [Paludibacter sp.]|nr:T9SS type A sorting domain-containing protein [Paludibacter sp.]
MKKLLFILFAILALPALTSATEYWADINFTRDSVFWGQGTTPPQPNNQNYSDRVFGDYTINGYFGRFNAATRKLNSENLSENFIMSWRLSTNAANQLVFPRYDNISRLKIHFYNVNTTIGGKIRLQYNSAAEGETAVWTDFSPALELPFTADNGSTSSTVIDTLLNLGATQLRIAPAVYGTGTGNKWLQVYAITISKTGPVSGIIDNEIDDIQLNLADKSLNITGANSNFKASIYNLAGARVGCFSSGENFIFSNSGVYMVKIETSGRTITKKLLVL